MEENNNKIDYKSKESAEEGSIYGLSESDKVLLQNQEERYQNYKRKIRKNTPKNENVKIKYGKKEDEQKEDNISKLEKKTCFFLLMCLILSTGICFFTVGDLIILSVLLFPIILISLYWMFSNFLKDYISCKARVTIFTVPLVFLSIIFGIMAILLPIPFLNFFIYFVIVGYNIDAFLLLLVPLMYSIGCAFLFLLLFMYKKIKKNDF